MHNFEIEQKGLGSHDIHFVWIQHNILGQNTQFHSLLLVKNTILEDFWTISEKNDHVKKNTTHFWVIIS